MKYFSKCLAIILCLLNVIKKDGAVAQYVRNDFIYTHRNDFCNSDKDCYESVLIQIYKLYNSKLNIGCVYRPLGHEICTLNDKFEILIQNISTERTECFLAGEYNINLLTCETHADTTTF